MVSLVDPLSTYGYILCTVLSKGEVCKNSKRLIEVLQLELISLVFISAFWMKVAPIGNLPNRTREHAPLFIDPKDIHLGGLHVKLQQ